MKAKLLILTILVLTTSCGRIPVQSVDLMTSIQNEGKRMHKVNLSMVNLFFNEKRQNIDNFIRLEYTPKYIEKLTEKIPEDVDVKKELPEILSISSKKINERRDAMHNTLEKNRIKILDKLNEDYKIYQNACIELKRLLESAVKVDEERKKLLNQASLLSENRVDFNQLEMVINNFIQDSGDLGNQINQFNESIDNLLTQKK